MTNGKQTMTSRNIVFCFQIHQPRRIKKLTPEEVQAGISCFDEEMDRAIIQRIANNCYLPMNKLLHKLITQNPQIKVCFSISGTTIEQLQQYSPEVIESFREFVETGSVDLLSETYFNSMAFLMEGDEFEVQVIEHCEKLLDVFGFRPTVFKNANFIYNDGIGKRISMMGYHGVMIEGNDRIWKHSSPHFLYEHKDQNGLKILMRNYRLSDDISFHVNEWSLRAQTFVSWLEQMPENEKLVNICVDYETFGEHNAGDRRVVDFIEEVLLLLAMQKECTFATTAEVVRKYKPVATLSLPEYVMVSGSELSDWFGNEYQRKAFTAVDELGTIVKNMNNPDVIRQWRQLQGCEHFYFMSDKADHTLSPYASSHEAFEYYMRALQAFKNQIQRNPELINETLESDRRTIHAPEWAMKIEHGAYHH